MAKQVQHDETSFSIELVAIDRLKPHPRNYQTHPQDELDHIKASIKEHGFYRNIVICRDEYILAGHGVVEGARQLGYQFVPTIRKDYDLYDPRALKILAGDNEIRHLAEVDDRALTELLKALADEGDLLGTGYDDMMLANLVMVTRPTSEIADLDAASQWVGMPEYDVQDDSYGRMQITVNFANEEDRIRFCHLLSIDTEKIASGVKSVWWPKPQEKDDVKSIHFADVGKA